MCCVVREVSFLNIAEKLKEGEEKYAAGIRVGLASQYFRVVERRREDMCSGQ